MVGKFYRFVLDKKKLISLIEKGLQKTVFVKIYFLVVNNAMSLKYLYSCIQILSKIYIIAFHFLFSCDNQHCLMCSV